MSILAKNVTKIYGKQKALDNVSFEIKKSEIVGFLGPNGAGKSTMMKIITGYIPPTSGIVEVNGLNIFEHSLEIKRQIGYLPEQNPLYYEMYVKEFLEFIAKLYGIKNVHQRVKEMIDICGLEIEQHKKIKALSKGYKQRVGLAQALIHNPSVLILDEPTSGLDPNQLEEIRQLIKHLGKDKTVMLSTHIMQEVEAVCNKVIIIHRGKIVASDSIQNIKQISSSTKIIIEFSIALSEKHFSHLPIKNLEQLSPSRWKMESDHPDISKELMQIALKNNCTILNLSKEELKLEEIFKALTQSQIPN
ncbi:MAG: gliding motility-associated ABC transporter ATP-binding subunit GldA [Bacteroidia bacterium]|nr:MAG: gliding motility-associated ABC transporter ATP-binding subunit GldA [Bacteroidia bacterium]